MNLARWVVLLVFSAAISLRGQDASPQHAEWTQPFEPFKILGNIYWVGGYDLSTYLITTPEGNILINTGIGATPRKRSPKISRSWGSRCPTRRF